MSQTLIFWTFFVTCWLFPALAISTGRTFSCALLAAMCSKPAYFATISLGKFYFDSTGVSEGVSFALGLGLAEVQNEMKIICFPMFFLNIGKTHQKTIAFRAF
jgi:hypothetical protein